MKYAIVFGASVAPLVAAHGMIKTPTPREAGSSMSSVCGSQIYNMLSSDAYGNIQGEEQLIGTDFTDECNLWLCKGMQYADNTANVQSYSTGEEVAITYDVRAPHTGTANVSIVDTATNTVIGDQLAYWSVFASNSQAMAANETAFSITIPDLAGKCTTAGECVIQHWWDSESAGQTYESCIDFTVGGSGSDSGSSSSAVVTSAAATSTKAAASSAAPTTSAAAVTSVAATTSTSKAVADVTTSSAAPTETADDDDSCDSDDGDDEDETTTTVAAGATTTSAAPAATETAEDDDSCDSDDGEDEEATATSSAFSAEATGEAGDDGEDDSCDSEDDEPTSSAAPTTLVTRTSSRAASATPTSKAATATAQPTSGSSSGMSLPHSWHIS